MASVWSPWWTQTCRAHSSACLSFWSTAAGRPDAQSADCPCSGMAWSADSRHHPRSDRSCTRTRKHTQTHSINLTKVLEWERLHTNTQQAGKAAPANTEISSKAELQECTDQKNMGSFQFWKLFIYKQWMVSIWHAVKWVKGFASVAYLMFLHFHFPFFLCKHC